MPTSYDVRIWKIDSFRSELLTAVRKGVAQALIAVTPVMRPGASVLHLATHAGIDPFVHPAAADRWLSLDEVLDHARVRAVDAGSTITCAQACPHRTQLRILPL
jgi:hypothetical protein